MATTITELARTSATARVASRLQRLLCLALFASAAPAAIAADAASQWPTVGGNPDSQRYTPLAEITKANLEELGYEVMHAPDARRAVTVL